MRMRMRMSWTGRLEEEKTVEKQLCPSSLGVLLFSLGHMSGHPPGNICISVLSDGIFMNPLKIC